MSAPPPGEPFGRLARLAAAGRLPPSLLFTGPPGSPTREAALWLAAVANSPDPEPDSDATRRIAERILWTEASARGSDQAGSPPDGGPWPDLHAVHANARGEIRVDALREAVAASRPRPFEGSRRFLLIAGADGMNPAAANALLKTLEEPHDRLGVVLTAVREAALLPTIVSRCQRWRFPGPAGDEVAARLREDHDYSEADAAWAALASGFDLDRALRIPRGRLRPLVEEARKLATVVFRGLPPLPRARLSERLARAGGRGRRGGGIPELPILFAVLRATLRDLAAIAAGAKPLSGDPGGALAPLAKEAPPKAFADALGLVEAADRAIHQSHGNVRMQLDALLLDFNEIARPIVIARMRAARRKKARKAKARHSDRR